MHHSHEDRLRSTRTSLFLDPSKALAVVSRRLAILAMLFISMQPSITSGQVGAIAPRFLIDPATAAAGKQIAPSADHQSQATCDKESVAVTVEGGSAGYPGITIKPESGKYWDLSPFGHIEAGVTNTGDAPLSINMAVDGATWELRNTETVNVKPGERKVIKVFFGYQYGYQPGAEVKPATISSVLFFLGKSGAPRSFRIDSLQASGPAGEKPPVDPNSVQVVPDHGVIVGRGVTLDIPKQVDTYGAKVSPAPDGGLAIAFDGGKDESVRIKPPQGSWNLSRANQVRVNIKNTGQQPVTPTIVMGPIKVASDAPVAPGADAEIVLSFIPNVPGVGAPMKGLFNGLLPGTGTSFESDKVKSLSIYSDKTTGARSLLVTSIVADVGIDELPAWLGKKPPVDGDWSLTFDEGFDSHAIDYSRWNIYGNNFWDKRTHFSKDNAVLRDGDMVFHYEKKTGFHNDDPSAKQTDYACGFLCTYGKWTQRYGYFEARMKLPKAPGLWPAFWLMPDRGKAAGEQWKRSSTAKLPTDTGSGGMEFDIMEFLSGWGVYRFNVALHIDGYEKDHKSVGSQNTYVRPDKDGYITTGLLWTPGVAVVYNNGREVFRWENPRVSDVQSYIMFDMVSGGWANTRLDDSKLPDDFRIDYVRAWQRKDLASPADGPKPNSGDPDERKN
jgi:beta-glucanase (GH16 family)